MAEEIGREEIVEGLRHLGLGCGMAVEVHSSLRSMGRVRGGAETVVWALMEVVGSEGAIVMSAYPLTLPIWPTEDEKARGIFCKVRFLSPDDPGRTGMGAVADAFRKWPGVCLGQGTHRVAAWGKDAGRHARDGYQYLLSIDGWTLLIGLDIHRCSAMHQAENKVKLPREIEVYFETPEDILRDYPPDEWYVEMPNPLEDAWGKVQAEAVRRMLVRRGKIGQAECMLFPTRPVVGIYEEWLRDDPYGLYGMEEPIPPAGENSG